MNGPKLVAGVDSSTQSTTVLVIDADSGETVREGRAPHPDGTEIDPEHWWQALLSATSGGLLDGVDPIGVGGQQHGMVALDETGNVVRLPCCGTTTARPARQAIWWKNWAAGRPGPMQSARFRCRPSPFPSCAG